MVQSFTSKSGRHINLRPPKASDVMILQNYINALVAEDAPILINRQQTISQEKEHVANIMKAIKAGERVQLLAFHGPKLIANAQVVKGKYRMSHVGTFGISVAKDYRDDGIGKKLAAAIIKLAINNLKTKLFELTVHDDNPRALHLYEKLGFKKIGVLPKATQYKQDLVDLVYMYRWIGKS
ncbi:MAG: GNAT family N-acetyltransferase [Candidatus Chisholmbacteria bacterium]|nr:GNAT family N-acetyltransferase [Candidatus Chisholmbacteria bacterium]